MSWSPGAGIPSGAAAAKLFKICSGVQASDNMTEALVSLVNLSTLAWRLLERDTSVHGTKGRLERARSTALLGPRQARLCASSISDPGSAS